MGELWSSPTTHETGSPLAAAHNGWVFPNGGGGDIAENARESDFGVQRGIVGAAVARKCIRIRDGARGDQSVVYDSSRLRRCQVPIAAVEGALRAVGVPSVAGEGEEIAASTRGKFRDNLSVVWAWRDGRGMRCLVAGHPWCLCDGHGAHRRAVSEMVGPGPHVGRTIPMLSPGAHRRPGGAMGAQVEKGRRSGRAAPLIGSPVLRKATGSPSGCATVPRGLPSDGGSPSRSRPPNRSLLPSVVVQGHVADFPSNRRLRHATYYFPPGARRRAEGDGGRRIFRAPDTFGEPKCHASNNTAPVPGQTDTTIERRASGTPPPQRRGAALAPDPLQVAAAAAGARSLRAYGIASVPQDLAAGLCALASSLIGRKRAAL